MEKTIALTGAEIKVEYGGGANAWLRNDGASTVYAARTTNADDVVTIPAGGTETATVSDEMAVDDE